MSDVKMMPYDAMTGEPLEPRDTPGYYPGFSTMKQKSYWDEATRKLIVDRMETIPAIRFFSPEEVVLMEAMLARLMPQDDRTPERQIAILPWIDQRLFRNESIGYRYETMPPDQQAYRLGLAAVAAMAKERYGCAFHELSHHEQELILESIHAGTPEPMQPAWKQMEVKRWWTMVMEDASGAYYAHPWAWDEIGFGGPAYPRGYMRLENGLPEPWEVDEQRYEWNAPADSLSGKLKSGDTR